LRISGWVSLVVHSKWRYLRESPDFTCAALAQQIRLAFGLTRGAADTTLNFIFFEADLKLHLANPGDTKLFTGYAEDHVLVNRERYDKSLAVLAEEVRTDWDAACFEALNETHFEYFLSLKPEVLLLGTGKAQRFPHPRLYRMLTDAGIGVECMDTPAACRTYNILVAEDRRVIAAIMFEGKEPETV
jgi:uncharacterized protein